MMEIRVVVINTDYTCELVFEMYLFLLQEKKKVTGIIQQLMVAHHSTMVEQLLVKYNIALPRYMKQAELRVLISHLYTDVPELGDTPGK